MLFNSPIFILMFLPIALLGFFGAARWLGKEAAIGWLVLASLFFYGWWNPAYLALIATSVLVNFTAGFWLPRLAPGGGKKALLTLGIVTNLGFLGYFKYANFFVDSINAVSGAGFELAPIVLPLAISFFTFQQIAYLVDAYRDATHEYNFLHYCLFVVFFPQLIAGPIVHHKEILPQFSGKTFSLRSENLIAGLTIFTLGLAKKVIIADTFAIYAVPVFDAADAGQSIGFAQAWVGALAYTFQLYFDFSGYSDMAIGLARMFGVRLPLNFNSPYKSASCIELWQRWHMTLSRFLRDYVYIPLGGNRLGPSRRYVNLFLTMLISGLWHGAGWTFVVWGALHGVFLLINHFWRSLYEVLGRPFGSGQWYNRVFATGLTFLAVTIGWVVFRAGSLESAGTILTAMSGAGGVVLPESWLPVPEALRVQFASLGITADKSASVVGGGRALLWVLGGCFVVFFMPNTQQIMIAAEPALASQRSLITAPRFALMQWRPNVLWAVATGLIAAVTFGSLSSVSQFLYFQF